MNLPTLQTTHIAVIGLGYVGLPLAVEFGKLYPTIGFDTDSKRIVELTQGIDTTYELSDSQFAQASLLSFSQNPDDLKNANVYIVCVPTPIDKYKTPNLEPLLEASYLIGQYLQKGNIIIYESTTYPTCTQNECRAMLEHSSGLTFNQDFYLGYSPERINPSDTSHTLTNIIKITSGSTSEVAQFVNKLYGSIIHAGTHLVSSMKTAEMAKIIENAQRDLNIAFMNEVHIICDHLGIDTTEMLEAAKTKWNFLPFSPGLVGGHCISIDPYYLTHKMNTIGYHPQIISSGRLINDAMPSYVAHKIIKLMIARRIEILDAKILILGITFKQNCTDTRNSQVPLVKSQLEDFGAEVSIYDPLANPEIVKAQYNITLLPSLHKHSFDGIFLAVAHNEFLLLSHDELGKSNHIFYTLTHHKLNPLS